MKQRTKYQKGSSTIEILIAFVILTFAITAIILVVFGNQNLSVDAQTNNEALYLAQAVLEQARADSRTDFFDVVSTVATTEAVGALTYTKKLDVSDIDIFTKHATSTVTWQIGPRTLSIEIATILTDPATALGGDTCSPTLTGDWTNPRILSEADVGSDNGGSDVDILSKRAYVTADSTQTDKDDFYIIDVSDPDPAGDLPILGTLHTGPGLSAVAVAGRYAYVANNSTVNQLQVIDVLNSASPTLVASYDVSNNGVGNSIFYSERKVYLGLTKSSDSAELHVFDVSDPLDPQPIATYETNTGINEIKVSDDFAYIATRYASDSTSAMQLRILDVSQAETGSISELTGQSPNPSTMSGLSLYMSRDGDSLYLGTGGANGGSDPQFHSYAITTPGTLSPGTTKFFSNPGTDISIRGLAVRENLLFIWTNDSNRAFQIWNLNNLSSEYGGINTSEVANGGFDCEGNYIFTASRSQRALKIIGPGPSVPTMAVAIHDNASGAQITSAPEGTDFYAKAALSGSEGIPTGNVEFTLYIKKENCTGPKAPVDTVALTGGVAYSSIGTLTDKPVSYEVHYEGDSNYSELDSTCVPLIVD